MTTDTEVTVNKVKKRKTPPPERVRVITDWERVAKRLRRHPGEWFDIFTDGPTSTASAVKAGKMTAIRPVSDFEFRTSNNKRTTPRTCDLHMRFVGEKEN